ncbi:LytR/AlgR family response regulator transcription factor [Tahibacter amnicola]|uniref:LytTR family DNA-binding domain-containing protein n=1 Tax=Tahibacter amnicola TaxID=2976241 RepID=A0ABY6BS39_9GAMM|nr:LytTR family DNA-binding domain-containing protein [Tahibacter amnicola]UXI70587.1 LytTR family DNA-binding domain-containing protein [Tahibacter amnicola]
MSAGTLPLKVLVVDDEPLARENVTALLERDAEVEVVGQGNGVDAVALVARLRPDILFLDIQMPEVDGFALLELIGADAVPAIVFVTAYDRYALRAFDVHALDYLLKPFTDARFASALDRAKEQVRTRRRGELDGRIAELLRAQQSPRTRFLVPGRDKTIVVEASQVDWIEAADYYICLHCGDASHLLRDTMDEVERQLDPQQFFRVHRSAIVNLARVREIHPLFRGDCELKLTDGVTVRLSRHRRREFEARFAQLGTRR